VQKLTKDRGGYPSSSQELIMKDPKTPLRVSIIGTTLVALCCFTLFWSFCSVWSACPR
jgi:hypothetical protein